MKKLALFVSALVISASAFATQGVLISPMPGVNGYQITAAQLQSIAQDTSTLYTQLAYAAQAKYDKTVAQPKLGGGVDWSGEYLNKAEQEAAKVLQADLRQASVTAACAAQVQCGNLCYAEVNGASSLTHCK